MNNQIRQVPMRRYFKTILFLFTGFLFPALLVAQDFQWAKTMGSGSIDAAISIKTDAAGNVYSTGVFSDSADFDPSPGVFKLFSAGAEDVFISRLDAGGNFMWAKAIGGMFSDYGTSLAPDISGNIYITGHFLGTVDFDPGPGTFNLTSAGSINTFVCKLDSQGNFVWAKSMGGTFQNSANALSIDNAGNIYLAGSFFETVDFDPGPGTFNLTSAGGQDIYLSKLDASGNLKWAKAMGGTSDDFPVAIAIDLSGNILTTGAFNETADFDPGSGVFNLASNGSEDIFISKIDSSGLFTWAKSMGSESFDEGQAITTDASGNVLVTGFFSFTVDFDPGTGVFNLSTPGDNHDYDIYILKLNGSGNFSWAKSIYATNFNEGRGIAVDATGKIYSTGTYQGASDFDPGTGTFTLTPTGSEEMYLSILNDDGSFAWAGAMAGNSAGTSLAIDAGGFVYTSGYFGEGSCDFDPGPGTFNATSNGMTDAFMAKYSTLALGIKPVVTGKKITVSPNPGNGIFTINSTNIIDNIHVFTVTGEEIQSIDWKAWSYQGNRTIDISNQPDGIYFIRAGIAGNNFIQKIVLQK